MHTNERSSHQAALNQLETARLDRIRSPSKNPQDSKLAIIRHFITLGVSESG
jgi:hypothetical protein